MTQPKNSNESRILEAFGSPEKAGDPKWLLDLRNIGASAFAGLGFPTLRNEDWRFTNVAPITELPFEPARAVSVNGRESNVLAQSAFASLPGCRLVFVNGFFAPRLSRIEGIPPETTVDSLANALKRQTGLIETHLGKRAGTSDNAFAALNQAFFTDGAFIHVPNGVVIAEPIQVIYITSAKRAGETVQPRNLVLMGANSKATIIESYLSTGTAVSFTNAVTEIVAGESAILEHVKLQDETASAYHVATIAGEFGRASNVSVHSFALGSKLSRNNIRARLGGEGLECILNGLYLTRDEQLADHHMVVEHTQPHCASHEYFNGILDDKSRGVFHGRIYVHPLAQKTDAKQTNKNLLLSDDATADTKPQLEIYADDVKCTHGATVGQLNGESVFYLRSRGIPEATARRMLIHAFAGEIVERIRCAPAREALDKLVWNRLETSRNVR